MQRWSNSFFSQMNKGNFVSKHFLDNLSEQFKLLKMRMSTPPNKSDFSETLFFIWAEQMIFITTGMARKYMQRFPQLIQSSIDF